MGTFGESLSQPAWSPTGGRPGVPGRAPAPAMPTCFYKTSSSSTWPPKTGQRVSCGARSSPCPTVDCSPATQVPETRRVVTGAVGQPSHIPPHPATVPVCTQRCPWRWQGSWCPPQCPAALGGTPGSRWMSTATCTTRSRWQGWDGRAMALSAPTSTAWLSWGRWAPAPTSTSACSRASTALR